MKINEIIKERRLLKKLTQEQMALYLGVTAPAVNKWEKGTSYPDITILPSLARLLDTDLNTLLSFKEDLTNQEVVTYINRLSEILEQDGLNKGYVYAMDKIEQYPTCYQLLLSVATVLNGFLNLSKNHKMDIEKYTITIENLYKRAMCSDQLPIRSQAQSMLITNYLKEKEYGKAEALLNEIPDAIMVDKKHLQAKLFLAHDNLKEAAQLEEERLLTSINEIQTTLIYLLDIALKDNRKEDAKYLADVSKECATLFDMWQYSCYVGHFTLYSKTKNRLQCIKLLPLMLKSITKKWDINQSPLYRHIKTNSTNDDFGQFFKKNLLQSINQDKETAFLKDSQEVQEIIKKYSE